MKLGTWGSSHGRASAAPKSFDDGRLGEHREGVGKRFQPGVTWGRRLRVGAVRLVVLLLIVVMTGLGIYWSTEPAILEFRAQANDPPGVQSARALVRVGETLLHKPGGYLANDVTPPSILLDNMPNWEFGVIVQLRDFVRAMRNDFSRSQSQSREDADLASADPRFSFDNNSWIFPSSESEYAAGIAAMNRYLHRLEEPSGNNPARFYARADNLRIYLETVGKRLGDQAQRLANSVGGDIATVTPSPDETPSTPHFVEARTPWMELDDVFYEARGATWAILSFLRAISIDFRDILENKNATVSLQQIIHSLEQAQKPVYSPLILNGRGYNLFANHSLILASYISRANAAMIDLRALLTQG